MLVILNAPYAPEINFAESIIKLHKEVIKKLLSEKALILEA